MAEDGKPDAQLFQLLSNLLSQVRVASIFLLSSFFILDLLFFFSFFFFFIILLVIVSIRGSVLMVLLYKLVFYVRHRELSFKFSFLWDFLIGICDFWSSYGEFLQRGL